jgi:hypothetical protein
MNTRIIYRQPNGRVAVIYPAPEALERYGIEAIARKDVPPGLPFKIIDSSELPTDQTHRDRWTCDDAILTDGVGNATNDWDVPPKGVPG